MKIDKIIYQKLRSFVNTLPFACHKMSMQYGLSVFAKARMFSHVSFIQKSLKVIPHDLTFRLLVRKVQVTVTGPPSFISDVSWGSL